MAPSPPEFQRKYALERFGDLSRTSFITDPLARAVQEAQWHGGGVISIPRGRWNLDPGVIRPGARGPDSFSGGLPNAPIWIDGQGPGATQISSQPGLGQSVLYWDASVTGNAAYGGVSNLQLRAANEPALGDGLTFGPNNLFMRTEHVYARGFDTGIASLYNQDTVFRDVQCAANRRNFFFDRPHQVRMEACYANQPRAGGVGVHMTWGWLVWDGGLLQGGGMLIAPDLPNGVRLTVRGVFVEQLEQAFTALPAPGFENGFSGYIRLEDISLNVGAAVPISEFHGYQLYLEGWTQGADGIPWGKFYNCSVYARGLPPAPGRWLGNQTTLDNSYWTGPGGIELMAG